MNRHSLNIISFSLLLLGVVLLFLQLLSLWLFIVLLLVYLLFLLTVSTNIRFNFFIKAYHHNPQVSGKKVAITFDDGPSENTLKILDLLDKYEAKCGFFCIGKRIEERPEVLREIVSRGHMVGNHTFSHTRKMGFLSSRKVLEEIQRCDEIVEKTTGLKMKLFRPPFGIINPKTQRALQQSGHEVIGWRVRSYDAIVNSPELVLKRITRKIRPGDVILLHDNNPQSLEILEQLLIFLQTNHYKAIRPDNLFGIDAYS